MPKNWKTYKLSEITTKIGSGATPRGGKEAYKESGISLIRSQNVLDFSFSINGLAFIDDTQANALKNVIVEPKDVLLNITGDSVARVCQVPVEWLPARVNQHVAIIRANQALLDPDYLLYALLSKENKNTLLTLASAGATRNAITKSMIEDFEITLPPLQEQRAIANILTAIDDKIEINLQQNRTLEEMAMALYKHWFVDFDFPSVALAKDGIPQPYKSSGGEFVESELGMIPKGWEVKRLEEEYDITIGRTPPRKEPVWFSKKEGVKWVSIKDMGNAGIYIFNTSEYLTLDAVKKKRVHVIATGTVILSFKLTVGRVSITTENMVTNEAIAHFNENDNTVLSNELLYLVLKSFDYNSLGNTSSIATAVNSKTVKSMKILVPEAKVVDIINPKVSSLLEQIKSNAQENQTLTKLRDTLLPKLISGEVRVKDIEQTLTEIL
tara:strand:- start:84870 stop:86189 length:1320 start_codon:yes stop_codon:yes gene_type:complete